MKFDRLLRIAGKLPWFDLATVAHFADEEKPVLVNQLSRWVREGRLLSLRRGMYGLPEPYRTAPLSRPALANALYRPSYLSGLWALGFYGLIPEMVVAHTSVTSRVPRRFENELGLFCYSHVRQAFFWGYEQHEMEAAPVLLATPEKALLDHWHLTAGEWTLGRLREMRYQQTNLVGGARLLEMAGRSGSPRLKRAAERFLLLSREEEEGSVVL